MKPSQKYQKQQRKGGGFGPFFMVAGIAFVVLLATFFTPDRPDMPSEAALITPSPELTYVLQSEDYAMLFPRRPGSANNMISRNSLGVEYFMDIHTFRDDNYWIALACHRTASKYGELYPGMTTDDILVKYGVMYNEQADFPLTITEDERVSPTERRWTLAQVGGSMAGVGRALIKDGDTYIVLGLADAQHQRQLAQAVDSLSFN